MPFKIKNTTNAILKIEGLPPMIPNGELVVDTLTEYIYRAKEIHAISIEEVKAATSDPIQLLVHVKLFAPAVQSLKVEGTSLYVDWKKVEARVAAASTPFFHGLCLSPQAVGAQFHQDILNVYNSTVPEALRGEALSIFIATTSGPVFSWILKDGQPFMVMIMYLGPKDDGGGDDELAGLPKIPTFHVSPTT
jgi:hypothetical protein